MFKKSNWKLIPCTLAVLFLCSLTDTAHAYLGPGAGLGMMGGFMALVVVVFIIIFGLLLYPIRRFLKHKSSDKKE